MGPILDGPPVFILLAFIVALAAYLRQISVGALALMNSILQGTAFPYRRASPESNEQLDFLNATRRQLANVTWWIFVLMLLVAIRIILYAISRMAWLRPSSFDEFRNWFDLALCVGVFALVCGMWTMHTKAREKDEGIRMRAFASLGQSQRTHPLIDDTPPESPSRGTAGASAADSGRISSRQEGTFQILQAHYLQEQGLFWQRFYSFGALHAGLFVLTTSSSISRPQIINWLGVILGILWVLVQCASRYYAKRLQDQYYRVREEMGVRPDDHWLFSRPGLSSTELALYATLVVLGLWLLMARGLVT